jgi:MFS family permease
MARLSTVRELAIAYGILWFTMNFYQAALTAVLPDRVPETARGTASSVIALGYPVGILVGVNLAANVDKASAYDGLGILLLLCTAVFVILAREEGFYPSAKVATSRLIAKRWKRAMAWLTDSTSFFRSFSSRDFTCAFFGRGLLFLSFFVVSGYQYYILQDYIGSSALPGNNPQTAMGILGTVQTLSWIISVSVTGWLADRLDRRKLFVVICSLGMSASMLLPVLNPTWLGMVVFEILVGAFFGTYLAVDLALMSLVLPDKTAEGRDMAILAISTASPTILSPMISGFVIETVGYHGLFFTGSVISLIAGVVVAAVKKVR